MKKLTKKENEILEILPKDRALAEDKFNALAAEEQLDLWLLASDEDRLSLVEIVNSPRTLMKQLPATEVWLTLRRLGPKDALSLLKYSTAEQTQIIFDIEAWKKDKMNTKSIYEWMKDIAECGIEKVTEYLKECDWDQITWFFKEEVVSYKKEDKDEDVGDFEWPREEMPMTYEGVYYFQVIDEHKDQVLRYFLEILAKTDQNLYWKLLESCMWDLPAIREEEAYNVRSRRLAEHGFPSFDEALEVYSPLKPSKLKMAEKRKVKEAGVEVAPRYPLVALGDETLFINNVIKDLSDQGEGDFLREIASIANRVMIADGCEINPEDLGKYLMKAIGYTNIGLEVLSGGDLKKAVALMEEYWTLTLFQVGLYQVMKLSQDVKAIAKDRDLEALEDDDKTSIAAIIAKRPKRFVGGFEYLDENFRDFLSMAELETARSSALKILK